MWWAVETPKTWISVDVLFVLCLTLRHVRLLHTLTLCFSNSIGQKEQQEENIATKNRNNTNTNIITKRYHRLEVNTHGCHDQKMFSFHDTCT